MFRLTKDKKPTKFCETFYPKIHCTVFTLQFSNFDDDNNMFEKSGIYLAGADRREMESIMLHLERENR